MNNKDMNILQYVKEELQDCVNYLNDNHDKIDDILERYADLQIDISEMAQSSFNMPDRYEEFPGMFVTHLLDKSCLFGSILRTLEISLSDTTLAKSIINDLDLYCYDNVDAQINAIQGVIWRLSHLSDEITK